MDEPQPPAYGSAEKPSDGGEAPPPAAGATSGAGHVTIDTRYPRSIEGILRIIIFPVAIIGIILDGVGGGLGGSSGFYFFVAVSHLIYIFIVFAIEMFVPNIFVHRLIDGIVSGVYAFLWGLASLLVAIFAGLGANVVFGIAAFFGVICCVLAALGAFFAFKTWREFEAGVAGSQAVIFI